MQDENAAARVYYREKAGAAREYMYMYDLLFLFLKNIAFEMKWKILYMEN